MRIRSVIVNRAFLWAGVSVAAVFPLIAACPAATSSTSSVGKTTGATSCDSASLAIADEAVVGSFNGKTVTYKDLGADLKKAEQKALRQYCDAVAGTRRIAFENHVTEALVTAEAKKANQTNDEWVKAQVEAKVPEPSDADIQAFYEEQKKQMGDQLPALEMVKPQVVGFLKREKSEAAVDEVIGGLMKGAKVEKKLPDVRSPALDLADGKHTFSKGNESSKIKVVEFADFECPYCSKAADNVRELVKKYGDKVEFSYRHFPLRQMHPNAQRAAEIAQCAGEQGKFWETYDAMYANARELQEENAKKLAVGVGVDEAKLTECLAAGRGAQQVQEDFEKGEYAGVEGTPSFFINGRSFQGNPTVSGLSQAIDEALNDKS